MQWECQGTDDVHASNMAPDSSGCFYYKAADDGAFDLAYDVECVKMSLADAGGRQLEVSCGRLNIVGYDDDDSKRAVAEQKMFDLVCQLFIREVMNIMQKAQPSLTPQELDVAVRALASLEVAAWQIQKHRSQVRPLTARILWQFDKDEDMCVA